MESSQMEGFFDFSFNSVSIRGSLFQVSDRLRFGPDSGGHAP